MSNLINLWISFITFAFSLTASAAGGLLNGAISPKACSIIGLVVFTAMGLWFIIDPFVKRHRERHSKHMLIEIMENPEEADINRSKDIDFKEATLLGMALSMDSIGGSLSAGMIGVNCFVMALLSALVSFLALWGGNYLAKLFIKLNLGMGGSIAAGVILIAVGVKQIL